MDFLGQKQDFSVLNGFALFIVICHIGSVLCGGYSFLYHVISE